jgi:hypothetical protein
MRASVTSVTLAREHAHVRSAVVAVATPGKPM